MNESEQHRHECEVRYVLQLRKQNRQRAHDYLELVGARRGAESAERLKKDAAELFVKEK